ncbi:MAG: DJ-1/PfpI family protein [Vampirovibrionales bacterium]
MMSTHTPRIAMVIAPETFRDEEYVIPRKCFEDAGCQVTVFSTRLGEALGAYGAVVTIDADLTQTPPTPETYDALMLVGGFGSVTHLIPNPEVHAILRAFAQAQKPTSAICISPMALAKAGVLAHKQATVWACEDSLACFQQAEVSYQEAPVVQDGHFLTGNGPDASEAFAMQLVAMCRGAVSV